MKRLFGSAILLIALASITSCRNTFDPEDDGNYRLHRIKTEQTMKKVRMAFGGDYIIESEEPLLRAEDGDSYAAVNVFRTLKNTEGAVEEKYAYGLFKKKEGIEVDLLTGYTYRFEATILTEREDKVFVNPDYSKPFLLQYEQNLTGTPVDYPKNKLNMMQYTYLDSNEEPTEDRKRLYFYTLSSGTAHVDADKDFGPRYGDLSYPRVKRFYGTYSGFDPEAFDKVEVNMDYKCFGLKIQIESLPSGSITVMDVSQVGVRPKEEKERLLFPSGLALSMTNAEWEGLYSLNNLLAESETIKLRFTWDKGGGEKETFDSEVTFSPGVKKILKVSVSGTPVTSKKGNLTLNTSSESLTEEVQEVVH